MNARFRFQYFTNSVNDVNSLSLFLYETVRHFINFFYLVA